MKYTVPCPFATLEVIKCNYEVTTLRLVYSLLKVTAIKLINYHVRACVQGIEGLLYVCVCLTIYNRTSLIQNHEQQHSCSKDTIK